jgi:hypothetical protein
MEEGFVDIKLRHSDSETVTLIEVKSDARPRYAIREALGQLLEYAFACEKNGESTAEMIVAGPGEVGPRDMEYIEHLRVRRGLPVHYVCFRRGTDRVNIEPNPRRKVLPRSAAQGGPSAWSSRRHRLPAKRARRLGSGLARQPVLVIAAGTRACDLNQARDRRATAPVPPALVRGRGRW